MKKIFEFGAWSALIFLIVGLISGGIIGLINSFVPLNYENLVHSLISAFLLILLLILSLIIFYAFILLGRKFKNKLLIFASWLGIIIGIAHTAYILFGGLIFEIPTIGLDNFLSPFLASSYIITSIIAGVGAILFGIGLLKLNKKIKYAKVAGILDIIAGFTMILFIGYTLSFIAVIFEMLMLFNASKRFEGKKKNVK